MKRDSRSNKGRRLPHARIHLPSMEPDQAVMVVDVLEKTVKAIWRAHGDAMADYLGCVAPDSMPRPPDAVWSGKQGTKDDTDLDF